MPADIRSFFGGSQGAAKPKATPVKKEEVSSNTTGATCGYILLDSMIHIIYTSYTNCYYVVGLV